MSQQINLYNPVFLKQEKLFSAVTMAQALAVIAVAVLAFAAYSTYQLTRVSNEAQAAAVQLQIAQEDLVKMVDRTKPVPVNKTFEEDISKAESRLQASRQILGFVQNGDLSGGKAYSGFLRAFADNAMHGVWLTGFTLGDGGNEIEINGRALQPAQVTGYLNALKKEGAFAGKSFGSMVLHAPQAEAVSARSGDVIVASSNRASVASTMPYIDFSLNSAEAGQVPSASGTGNK